MGNMPDERKEKVAKVVIAATNTGKKGLEFASNVLASTASGSKVVADNIAKSAKQMSEKAKENSEIKRLKKLNPLFPDEYWSEEFYIPNIICIVDDAVRRDVDGCQGAIGWRENKKGTEVLFLYDEFVEECGLKFVPAAIPTVFRRSVVVRL